MTSMCLNENASTALFMEKSCRRVLVTGLLQDFSRYRTVQDLQDSTRLRYRTVQDFSRRAVGLL